jgi:CRP-like cAMP-binding protein
MDSGFFDYPDVDSAASRAAAELRFLPDWTDDEWARLLRHAAARPFRLGETVIRAGESERSLMIVVDGRLDVFFRAGQFGREVRRQSCDAGSVIGEQAFLDGLPRSATIRAVTDGRLMQLTPEAFEAFAGHWPALGKRFLFDLGRIVSLRLRRTTAMLEREGR